MPLSLTLHHRCRSIAYDRPLLECLAADALPACVAIAKAHHAGLATLPSVEVSVVGTRAMAKVHRDFLAIPGATDVITFPYGEILVCAPVAAARAPEFGHTTTLELALYIIHGLLHLSGHDDTTPAAAEKIATAQQHLLKTLVERARIPMAGGISS
jgi:probable rRNA maturation factor